MIRSNLPIPFLYRLRLRASSAARRAQSSLVQYRQPRGVETHGHLRPLAARRTAGSDAAAFWAEFIDQYERFTDVLCAAAKTGCDGRTESEYAQVRCWLVANYYRIAARLRPYLETEFAASDAVETPVVVDYAGQKRAFDVLEALFLPPTLRALLTHDSGDLIPRVARISEAVYRCHSEWESSHS